MPRETCLNHTAPGSAIAGAAPFSSLLGQVQEDLMFLVSLDAEKSTGDIVAARPPIRTVATQ